MDELRRSLYRCPETIVAVKDPKGKASLARWLAVDPSDRRSLYRGRDSRRPARHHKLMHSEFPPGGFRDDIDDLLLDGLHRGFYGFPREQGHDDRTHELKLHGKVEDPEWDELYDQAVADLTEARAVLLSENLFLSTREVVELLSNGATAMGRDWLLLLRRWGHVLAIPDHGRWLYPEFQFRDGVISPFVFALHTRLRENRRTGIDADAWIQLTFWSTPADELHGRAPKELLWNQRDAAALDRTVRRSGM